MGRKGHSCTVLPEGYGELFTVNLQKDRRVSLLVNGAGLGIAAAMVIGMNAAVPVRALLDLELGRYALRLAVLLASGAAYLVLHELTHGAVMRYYGTGRVRFGFTGLYAYAGSTENYFDAHSYLRVALAPVACWGVLLTALCLAVPRDWLWVAYLVQVMNVSGSAGDIYVWLRFRRIPRPYLVRDTGIEMTVYRPGA